MGANPATFLALLQQTKLNYLTTLATLSAAIKPDYNLDGQGIQWMQYQMAILERAIARLNILIQLEGNPQELLTQAIPAGGQGGLTGPNGYG